MNYEAIHDIASSLSLAESVVGFAGSVVAAQRLGRWTLGGKAWWKGPLSLIYIGAILCLFFFTYSMGINALLDAELPHA